MVKKYYIFRHGDTFATKAGTAYGIKVFSAPILPEAKVALEKMGTYLNDHPTDYNVTSPLLRCRQTAKIVGELSDKQFETDKRLREFFLETIWNLRRRVKSFLKDLDNKGYETVAICTHGAVISELVNILTGRTLSWYQLPLYPDPGILTIITENNIEQINFNLPL